MINPWGYAREVGLAIRDMLVIFGLAAVWGALQGCADPAEASVGVSGYKSRRAGFSYLLTTPSDSGVHADAEPADSGVVSDAGFGLASPLAEGMDYSSPDETSSDTEAWASSVCNTDCSKFTLIVCGDFGSANANAPTIAEVTFDASSSLTPRFHMRRRDTRVIGVGGVNLDADHTDVADGQCRAAVFDTDAGSVTAFESTGSGSWSQVGTDSNASAQVGDLTPGNVEVVLGAENYGTRIEFAAIIPAAWTLTEFGTLGTYAAFNDPRDTTLWANMGEALVYPIDSSEGDTGDGTLNNVSDLGATYDLTNNNTESGDLS